MAVAWRSAPPAGASPGSSGRRPKRASAPVRTIAGRERPLPPHVLRHRPPPALTVGSPAPGRATDQQRHRATPQTVPPRRSQRIHTSRRATMAAEEGQAAILLLAALMAILVGALILGAVAKALGTRDDAQRTADLAALAGAKAMHGAYARLFEPAALGGRPNPQHLEKAAYLELGRQAALDVARRNGAVARTRASRSPTRPRSRPSASA